MKVAIIHYWLINWRGGEKVLQALLELFPQADIYTHVYDAQLVAKKLPGKKICTTFIHKLPLAKSLYQKYLPLMPMALEQLDLRQYDLIISSESGPSKGVVSRPDALHICYCHSPMRYVWDMYPDYKNSTSWLNRLLMIPLVHYLKIWDRLSADRVDAFVANSDFVAQRIHKFYRRSAKVIYPPVAVDTFDLSVQKSDFYLVLGQLTSYKRADLAVDAFLVNNKKLIVIGEGEQYHALSAKAKNCKRIQILGRLPRTDCLDYLARAKALIFPGVEDFGMVPVEAMSCGTPVIAYQKGGALESVRDGISGIFFKQQTIQALNQAITKFEQMHFDPKIVRQQAEKFSTQYFKQQFSALVTAQKTHLS